MSGKRMARPPGRRNPDHHAGVGNCGLPGRWQDCETCSGTGFVTNPAQCWCHNDMDTPCPDCTGETT